MWSLFLIIICLKLGPQIFIIMKRLFIYRIFIFEGSTILRRKNNNEISFDNYRALTKLVAPL